MLFILLLASFAVLLVWSLSSVTAAESVDPTSALHNDDFCDDLTTGGDENNSAACSGLTKQRTFFQCLGSKYLKQRVPSSRVGDGVCDCCDGSDEFKSTSGSGRSTICIDTCASQEEAEKNRLASLTQKRQRGAKLKAASLQTTREEMQTHRGAVEKLRKEGAGLEDAARAAENALEETERLLGIQLEDSVKEAHVSYSHAIKELFVNTHKKDKKTLQHLTSALVLRGREETGEAVLKAAEKGGFFVGPGEDPDDTQVLMLSIETAEYTDENAGLYHIHEGEAVLHPSSGTEASAGATQHQYDLSKLANNIKLHTDSLELMSEALALGRMTDAGLLTVLQVALMEAQKRHVLGLALLDVNFHLKEKENDATPTPTQEDYHAAVAATAHMVVKEMPPSPEKVREIAKNAPLPPDAAALQAKVEAAKAQKAELEAAAKASADVFRFSYGENDYLYALSGTCSSTFHRGYTYRVCPFSSAKQDKTLIGDYDSHSTEKNPATGEEFVVLHFKQGSYCHASRRPRDMHVRLECSDEASPRLTNVEEPEVCSYTAVLLTNAACKDSVYSSMGSEL